MKSWLAKFYSELLTVLKEYIAGVITNNSIVSNTYVAR